MKEKVSPVVVIVTIVVVVAVVVWFGMSRMSGTGLSKVEEDKYLKPLQMPGPSAAGAPNVLAPPPPTGGNAAPMLPPGGGSLVPPPPPR